MALAPRMARTTGVREVTRHATRQMSSAAAFRIAGGRSSVAGLTATVFGSTGFLGRYVVNKLGRVGTAVVTPHRLYDEDNTRHLKLMGDLGMINAIPFHARDPDSIAAAVEKSDVVINLLGKQMKTRNFDYVGSNVEAVSNIAKVCKEVGVPKFVHVSALAASEDSPSEWLRCKAMGEAQVRNYYPDATILRPNVIYGEEDNFLNLMAKWTKIWGVIPLLGNGGNVLQPVYVDDVAECVRAAVFESVHEGKTYELSGPESMSLYKTARWVQETTWRKDRPVRCVPDLSGYLPDSLAAASPHRVAGAMSNAVLSAWPGDMFGPMSMVGPRGDYAAFGCTDWLPNPMLPQMAESFNITPTPMKKVAPEYLRHYRQGGHYAVIHKADQTGV